ncbi:MAG: hypothetical protein ACO1NS_08945 [Daejeonella sp.]|uniref:hypothetical protein n=1 Tax=Daejeonella sp. JGW-45 TaxID=3034148 RepID=UPI0023ED5D17|nr:hypothetical protein [Daejeonella sp. JGW-45]
MRKSLSLLALLVIDCFAVFSQSVQVKEERRSGFMELAGMVRPEDPKDISSLRFKEADLNAAGIEKDARLIKLKFDQARGIIRLQDMELIEDDAPAAGLPQGYKYYDKGPVEWVEDLKKGIVIKKILVVDNPAVASARLVFKGMEVQGNREPLHLSLNGEKLIRQASVIAYPHARQYIDMAGLDRWYYIDLPHEKLRKGNNEILMWTESDSTSWRVLIAHINEFKRGSLTRTSPNRSMKSLNNGGSWSDSRLGAMNLIDGEYSIRLSLDRFLPSGEYLSPLMDLVNEDDPLKRNSGKIAATFWPDFDVPAQTSLKSYVRFGSSPFIGDESWTKWQPLEKGHEYSLSDKRYIQWKAELSTTDPLATPVIRGLRIKIRWEDLSTNANAGIEARVINNGKIIEPSYPFSYENLNHLDLAKYRTDHKLDQIVKGARNEFEVMMRLLNWSYRVPLTSEGYSWNWNDVTVTPVIAEGSGMPQLNGPVFKGRRMVGMCLYPNQALIGALLSMGYQARHINIHSEGESGHEVTEVWSNQLNKWIYMDSTRDYYYYDPKTGVPFNLLEIHNLLAEQMPRVETWQRPFAPEIGEELVARLKVGQRQGNNPFPIQSGGGNHLLEIMGHFRIIPRNDFLSNPLPVPVRTGFTMWGWDGFLNWYDNVFPKRDEYQRYTNRASDFYQPLNQAKVYLTETQKAGTLKVEVDNFTPGGFDSFLVASNDGEWISRKENLWNWELQSGLNSIKVRTKNSRGILGPVSELQVMYNP